MTCIVGLVDKEKGNVIIGADRAGVSGLDIMERSDPKVFKIGDFVIGCTSSFRMIQLLRFSLKPRDVGDIDIYEYMCTLFVDDVIKCFDDGGYLQKYKDGDKKGGCFIVGYRDRLFTVQGDFQVAENIIGYDSVGCGEPFAKGSLYATEKEDSARERVVKALMAAEKFSGGVVGPFVIIET